MDQTGAGEPRTLVIGAARGIGWTDQTVLRLMRLPFGNLPRNLARGCVGAHDPGHGIHIGNRDGRDAQAGGTLHELLRVGRPGEKGKIRGDA